MLDGDLCEQFNSLEPAKKRTIAEDLDRTPNEVSPARYGGCRRPLCEATIGEGQVKVNDYDKNLTNC